MAARIRTVIMNTTEPGRLADFWSRLLEVEVRDSAEDIVWLHADSPGAANVGFQQVGAKVAEHTETHLDVAVDDLDAAQRLIEELGGSLLITNVTDGGFEWRIMLDPDGNEFCIFVE